ncbi:hypothetical protein Pla110_00660 [Polystyrenella longa]|uniref:Beta-propeller repeat protein n=1 Tax=Polystyrenella longa TaxID=2528007 RepID=A0A518CGL3_9PLAN|nr:hypothetical protein [Polystyrenella longa]QDU78365.1 hypothetical protein Pla110_00660 [Polystyrenella longa]
MALAIDGDDNVYCFQSSNLRNILKIDGDGNVINTYLVQEEYSTAVADEMKIDFDGNMYISGRFAGELKSGTGEDEIIYESTSGGVDGFVLKMDNTGTREWVKQFAISDGNSSVRLSLDENGNAVVLGDFKGTIDFEYGNDSDIRTSNGLDDVFLAKLNSTGELQWGHTFGDVQRDSANSINIDSAGNIFVAGRFRGNVDLDPTVNTNILEASLTKSETFIARFDTNGDLVWAGSMEGSSGGPLIASIDFDQQENLIIGASLFGTSDIDPGPDTYILDMDNYSSAIFSLDTNVNVIWAATLDGTFKTQYNYSPNSALDLVVADDDSIYMSGSFKGKADAQIGPGTSIISANEQSQQSPFMYLWKVTPESVDSLGISKLYQADFDFGLPANLIINNPGSTSTVEASSNKQLMFSNAGGTGLSTAVWNSSDPLPEIFEISAEVTSVGGLNSWLDGFLIFDYQSETDFKYAGFLGGQNQWIIGHYQGHWGNRAAQVDWDDIGRTIDADVPYTIHLRSEGATVFLSVNGEFLTQVTFDSQINNRQVGIASFNAVTRFDNLFVGERIDEGAPTSLPYYQDFASETPDRFLFTNPHLWTVDTYEDQRYLQIDASDNQGLGIGYIDFEWPMPNSYEMSALVTSMGGPGRWLDGFLVFDYQSPTDFKYAGMFTGQNQWVIGHYQGNWGDRVAQNDWDDIGQEISVNIPYNLHISVDGNEVTLRANGIIVASGSFENGVGNGTVGVAAQNAITRFDNLEVDVTVETGKAVSLPFTETFDDGAAQKFYYNKPLPWKVVAPTDDPLLRINTSNGGGQATAYVPVDLDGSEAIEISASIRSNQISNGWHDGFLIFDYKSQNDFKYAGFYTGQNQWVIGHFNGTWNNVLAMEDWDNSGRSINFNQFYDLTLHIDYTFGFATLSVDGEEVVSTSVDVDPREIETVGVAAANAFSWFDNFSVKKADSIGIPVASPIADPVFANWKEESDDLLS